LNLLLDTHAIIWFFGGIDRLSLDAFAAISDPGNAVHISAVSAYEITLKIGAGKLKFQGGMAAVRQGIESRRFAMIDLTFAHCEAAGMLDQSHRDPFDRMLAAQSALEGLPLVTADSAFALFGTKTIW
jgi:PIN domain nuclease of toxin-antitoxin system